MGDFILEGGNPLGMDRETNLVKDWIIGPINISIKVILEMEKDMDLDNLNC